MPQAIVVAAISTAVELGAGVILGQLTAAAAWQAAAGVFSKHLLIDAEIPAAVRSRNERE